VQGGGNGAEVLVINTTDGHQASILLPATPVDAEPDTQTLTKRPAQLEVQTSGVVRFTRCTALRSSKAVEGGRGAYSTLRRTPITPVRGVHRWMSLAYGMASGTLDWCGRHGAGHLIEQHGARHASTLLGWRALCDPVASGV
jgi:hypothetical protein